MYKILHNQIKNLKLQKHLFLMIFIAFCFSVLARLYWVFWASEYPIFFWNDTLMISTNDGYAFAEGVRDMIAGFHQENDLSYYGSSLSTLTYYIIKLFNIKIEIAMLYMSVVFGSFIVIPILLISNEYKNLKIGFVAALIASIANSYYNRTMTGYYDTDMLNIVLPLFIIWGLIRVSEQKRGVDTIIAPIFIITYNWWYGSGFSLIMATITIFFIYTIIFERKNLLFYLQISLLILAVANLNLYIKFILIFSFYSIIFIKNLYNKKFIFSSLAIALAIFTACGGLNPIIFQLKFYLFREVSEVSNLSFKFFNVNQTIQESGIVDFVLFCERISGSVPVFLISIFGVLLFCFKHRSFCVALAMLGLGILALKGGLRFTIYAVPIAALGFGFFIVSVAQFFNIKDNRIFNTIYALATFLAIFPIAEHIKNYKISPVFMKSEVEILDRLKSIAKRDDYVLAWWDYGYPIRYYSDVKTLIDGGKHLGKDNFAVSFALSQDQQSSANMARLEVEYTQRNFKEKFGLNLNKMLSDANSTDINDFLNSLKNKNINLAKKTSEIYYYLPDRMIYIFPTILQFSRLDLQNGKSWGDPLFYYFENYKQNENGIQLGGNIILSNNLTNILLNGMNLNINTFFEVKTNENDNLEILKIQNDTNSKLYVIFMRDYARFLVLDESMLNSTFIQLFVFENYDKELFEPVILENSAKIYRLKI